MSEARKQSLHRKLFLARKEVKDVEKRGVNEDYNFARAEDVAAEAKRVLEKRHILVLPKMVDEELILGEQGVIAKAVIEFEVRDTQTGETLTFRWSGTGHDRPGDKALYKATTGAGKYFLANLLGISFGSDPETSTGEDAHVGDEDGDHLLPVEEIRDRLRAAGAPAGDGALHLLFGAAGVPQDEEAEERGFLSVTREQGEAVLREVRRIEQDHAAEAPDEVPAGV